MEEVTLRSLYLEEGLSAKQIADRLEVPESKVVYWLRKYQIPKRSLSEAVIGGSIKAATLSMSRQSWALRKRNSRLRGCCYG